MADKTSASGASGTSGPPGMCGFAIFCVVLALTLPHLTIVASFSVALAMQLVLQTLLFRRV